jgi:regulator of sigma D
VPAHRALSEDPEHARQLQRLPRNLASSREPVTDLAEGAARPPGQVHRDRLLVKYTAIAATLDRSATAESINAGIERLCQLLVDYVSAGHFEVFYALQREAESFNEGGEPVVVRMVAETISQIGDTTEVILGFEEKYPSADTSMLEADLSLLGEVLERRFALEDQLIAGLHRRHAEQPAG